MICYRRPASLLRLSSSSAFLLFSFLNFPSDVFANGVLNFPRLSATDGLLSGVAIVNPTSAQATVAITAHGADGNPLEKVVPGYYFSILEKLCQASHSPFSEIGGLVAYMEKATTKTAKKQNHCGLREFKVPRQAGISFAPTSSMPRIFQSTRPEGNCYDSV